MAIVTIRSSTDGIYKELDELKGLSSGQFNESSLIATSAEEISVTLGGNVQAGSGSTGKGECWQQTKILR